MTVFVLMMSLLISPNTSSQLSPLSHAIPHVSNFLCKLSKHERPRSHSSQPPMAAASAADRMFPDIHWNKYTPFTELQRNINHPRCPASPSSLLHADSSFKAGKVFFYCYFLRDFHHTVAITFWSAGKKKIQSSKWAPLFRFDSPSIRFCWHPESSKDSGRVLAEARLPLSESCTLAILLACVLLALLFLSSLFCPLSVLTVAFAGCCSGRHIVLYSLFDSLRLAIIFVCC